MTEAYAPYISSFSPTGMTRWATIFPDAYGCCYTIATSAAGRSAVVLLASGRSGRLVVSGITYAPGTDIMLGVTAMGAADWVNPAAGPWAFSFQGAADTFLLTGFVESPTDLGGGVRPAFGSFDAVAASYDITSGAHRWSALVGSTGGELGRTIAPNGAGGAWVAGDVRGDATPLVAGDFGERDFLLFEVNP